jgi:hypothetical protein
MRKPGRTALATALAAAAFVPLVGCGSSKHATGSHAVSQPSAAARATVDHWGKASTPQAVCALLSYGWKLGAGQGKSPAKCASWITSVLGPFFSASAKIFSSRSVGRQTAVDVSFGNIPPQTLYLVPECGTLKVNSIGTYYPNPPKPPSC